MQNRPAILSFPFDEIALSERSTFFQALSSLSEDARLEILNTQKHLSDKCLIQLLTYVIEKDSNSPLVVDVLLIQQTTDLLLQNFKDLDSIQKKQFIFTLLESDGDTRLRLLQEQHQKDAENLNILLKFLRQEESNPESLFAKAGTYPSLKTDIPSVIARSKLSELNPKAERKPIVGSQQQANSMESSKGDHDSTLSNSIDRYFEDGLSLEAIDKPGIIPSGKVYEHNDGLTFDPENKSIKLKPTDVRPYPLFSQLKNYYLAKNSELANVEIDPKDIPDLFKDPITGKFFVEPVVDREGNTREKEIFDEAVKQVGGLPQDGSQNPYPARWLLSLIEEKYGLTKEKRIELNKAIPEKNREEAIDDVKKILSVKPLVVEGNGVPLDNANDDEEQKHLLSIQHYRTAREGFTNCVNGGKYYGLNFLWLRSLFGGYKKDDKLDANKKLELAVKANDKNAVVTFFKDTRTLKILKQGKSNNYSKDILVYLKRKHGLP